MSATWPLAERPTPQAVTRRKIILEAASNCDVTTVREYLTDCDDRVRETALRALHRLGSLNYQQITEATSDGSARVRRGLAEISAIDNRINVADLISDADASVCEIACWAAGERSEQDPTIIQLLTTIAVEHSQSLCRESAVAALGAIGSSLGLPAILAATSDKTTVRRRAVLALAPFESPEVTEAITRALNDRDWQVRQAAEDLSGFHTD